MRLTHPYPEYEIDVEDHEVVIAVTRDELAILQSTCGETLEAIPDWKFEVRVGATREEVRSLIRRIQEIRRTVYIPE